MKVLTAISLFAGAGGCSLGFKRAGVDIIKAYDNNKAAVNTYNRNFGDGIARVADLSTLNPDIIANETNADKRQIDILIGGPPCQGFSSAGIRVCDDPRNKLIKNYVAILDRIKPKWFLMENVEGMLTLNGGSYVFEAIQGMIQAGYVVRLEKVYSHEYGVPQRRKRVIVLGNRVGIPFNFPKIKNHACGKLFRNSSSSLRNVIEDIESNHQFLDDHQPKILEGIALKRVSMLKEGQTMKDLPEQLQHESFKKRANRRVSDGTPTEKRGGAPSGIKRLVYDEPSLTITSAATREFIHPKLNRPLTIRECARIQTFPDTFHFCGNANEKIRQIGNAIPPKLAKVFANHLIGLASCKVKKKMLKPQLLGFSLTKSKGMSPALKLTEMKLQSLMISGKSTLPLFSRAM